MRPLVLALAAEVAALGFTILKMDRPKRPDQPNPEEPPNTYGLPEGEDIQAELVRWFRDQLGAILGTIPDIGAPLPHEFLDLADYDDPMAAAMTPLLSAYWEDAGHEARARIGLDPASWRVTDPHLKDKIRRAAFDFCHATNQTTSLELRDALDALRVELTEGLVTRGESLPELTRRVQGVFDQAETWRARRIATSEASRATHAAEYESARTSGVVAGLEWLASEDCCPQCAQIAAQVKRVRLGERFAISGTNPTYRNIYYPPLHPACRCSVVEILDTSYGGPANPEWGTTLNQPDGTDYEDVVPVPRPEARKPITKPGPFAFTTYKEVHSYLKTAFPNAEIAGIERIPTNGWNLITTELERLVKDWPEIADQMQQIGADHRYWDDPTDGSDHTIACASHPASGKTRLAFNPKYFAKPDNLATKYHEWEASGWMPVGVGKSNGKAAITHEWGHLIDGWVLHNDPTMDGRYYESLRKPFLRDSAYHVDTQKAVSRYATTDHIEAVAEAFTGSVWTPEDKKTEAQKQFDANLRVAIAALRKADS